MRQRRAPARKGLSYYDANRDRLVTIEDDVLGIKQEIESRWPEVVNVFFDTVDEVWVLTQVNGPEESLLFTTKVLDGRVIERIKRAENSVNSEDPLKVIDAHNADVERDQERKFDDQLAEFAERFNHALRKDGFFDVENIYGTRNPRLRTINRR